MACRPGHNSFFPGAGRRCGGQKAAILSRPSASCSTVYSPPLKGWMKWKSKVRPGWGGGGGRPADRSGEKGDTAGQALQVLRSGFSPLHRIASNFKVPLSGLPSDRPIIAGLRAGQGNPQIYGSAGTGIASISRGRVRSACS